MPSPGARCPDETTLALFWQRSNHASTKSQRRIRIPAGIRSDELDKYRSWRNYLKGLFDSRTAGRQILVTGSARLDFYRFGGDSLQGRYHLLRLHPLSVAELGLTKPAELQDLLNLGGFPEPYFSGSA